MLTFIADKPFPKVKVPTVPYAQEIRIVLSDLHHPTVKQTEVLKEQHSMKMTLSISTTIKN